MARGFVAGGLSFGLFGLVCLILTAAIPMWLVSRTELVHDFCWFGEGIWAAGTRWGDSVPALRLTCSPDAAEELSSYDAYCKNSTSQVTLDGGRVTLSEGFRAEMCKRTTASKWMVVFAGIFSVFGLGSGYLAHLVRLFKLQIYCSAAATLSCLFAFLLECGIMITMQTSPLFAEEHREALSTGFGNKYEGISCAYQIPSPSSFFRYRTLSGPMECLFPGPSFAFCLAAMVCSLFATMLFSLKLRESIMIRKISLEHLGTRELLSSRYNLHSPLFGGNLEPSPDPQEPLLENAETQNLQMRNSGEMDSPREGSEPPATDFSPGTAIPARFKFERHYSIYGAFLRRFSHHPAYFRNLLNSVPPLLNVLHAVLLGMWIMNGSAFATQINIDALPRNHHVSQDESIDMLQKAAVAFLDLPEVQEEIFHRYEIIPKWENVTILQHMIEFSPITTVQVFFNAGAYSFCLVQLVSTFIWPIVKVLFWSWFWYTPADEVFRGRLYTMIDALGKIALANLYIFMFQILSNHFHRVIVVPWYVVPQFPLHLQNVRVSIQFAVNTGFGTYGYVLSFVLSMLMGEANVAAHRFAKSWEERRREEEEATWRKRSLRNFEPASGGRSVAIGSRGVTFSHQQQEENDTNDQSRPRRLLTSFQAQDTPFMMMAQSHENFERSYARVPRLIAEEQDEDDERVESFDVEDRSPLPAPPVISDHHEEDDVIAEHVPFADDIMDRQVQFYKRLRSEACSDHIFSPIQGQFHRCTSLGKAFIALFILSTLSTLVISLFVPVMEFRRSGIVGDFIIPYKARNLTYAIVDIPSALTESGLEGQYPTSLILSVIVFVIIMPIIHIVGLSIMWSVPLGPRNQIRIIHILEIVSAWSAIDVFTLCLLFTHFDLKAFTQELIDSAGLEPLDEFLRKYFPSVGAFIVEELVLLDGYAVLVATVVLEKVLEHIVQLQYATMIAERIGIHSIEKQAAQVPYLNRLERQQREASVASHLNEAPVRSDHLHPLSNSLIREHMDVLSPAARYVFASSLTPYIYAGLPTPLWRLFEFVGIIERDHTFEAIHRRQTAPQHSNTFHHQDQRQQEHHEDEHEFTLD